MSEFFTVFKKAARGTLANVWTCSVSARLDGLRSNVAVSLGHGA